MASNLLVVVLFGTLLGVTSSKRCHIREVHNGESLDITSSISNGATAVNLQVVAVSGDSEKDKFAGCFKLCCDNAECNIASYLTDGCHLQTCWPTDKCRWSSRDSSSTMLLRKDMSKLIGTGHLVNAAAAKPVPHKRMHHHRCHVAEVKRDVILDTAASAAHPGAFVQWSVVPADGDTEGRQRANCFTACCEQKSCNIMSLQSDGCHLVSCWPLDSCVWAQSSGSDVKVFRRDLTKFLSTVPTTKTDTSTSAQSPQMDTATSAQSLTGTKIQSSTANKEQTSTSNTAQSSTSTNAQSSKKDNVESSTLTNAQSLTATSAQASTANNAQSSTSAKAQSSTGNNAQTSTANNAQSSSPTNVQSSTSTNVQSSTTDNVASPAATKSQSPTPTNNVESSNANNANHSTAANTQPSTSKTGAATSAQIPSTDKESSASSTAKMTSTSTASTSNQQQASPKGSSSEATTHESSTQGGSSATSSSTRGGSSAPSSSTRGGLSATSSSTQGGSSATSSSTRGGLSATSSSKQGGLSATTSTKRCHLSQIHKKSILDVNATVAISAAYAEIIDIIPAEGSTYREKSAFCFRTCCETDFCNVESLQSDGCHLETCWPLDQCVWLPREGATSKVLRKDLSNIVSSSTTGGSTAASQNQEHPETQVVPPPASSTATAAAATQISPPQQASSASSASESSTSESSTSASSALSSSISTNNPRPAPHKRCRVAENHKEEELDIVETVSHPGTNATVIDIIELHTNNSEQEFSECFKKCCQLAGCNIASVLDDGCYLLTCWPPQSCRWKPSKDAMSMRLRRKLHFGNAMHDVDINISGSGDIDQKNSNTTGNGTSLSHLAGPSPFGNGYGMGSLIATLTMSLVFLVISTLVVSKRFYESWKRRHYQKIDYLVDGMYG